MTGEPDDDLPLHDEAKARSKWRGGQTLLDQDDAGASGLASEVDDAAQDGGGAEDALPMDAAQTPPD